MSTCRQLVTRAERWHNAVSEGNPVPSAYAASVGLEDLQALYFDIIEKSSNLQPVWITSAYTAGENQRIYGVTAGSPVVTFPSFYSDKISNDRFNLITDDAVDNTKRPPSDFAVIAIAGSPSITKVYDAVLGSWVAIEGLTLDSEAPWSTYLGQAMSAMLATLVGSRLGFDPSPTLAQLSKEGYDRAQARIMASGLDGGSTFFQPERARY